MAPRSAGIVLYRRGASGVEVLLAHPGGPFWANKDDGAWTIPKGLVDAEEDALNAARREFLEETGHPASGDALDLGIFVQPGGKRLHAFAVAGNLDAMAIRSNMFSIEWPPRSGRRRDFPEVDRAAWFALADARSKVTRGQVAILDALAQRLARASGR